MTNLLEEPREDYNFLDTQEDYEIGISDDGSEAIAYLECQEAKIETIDTDEMVEKAYSLLNDTGLEPDTYKAVIEVDETVEEEKDGIEVYESSQYREEIIMSSDSAESLAEK